MQAAMGMLMLLITGSMGEGHLVPASEFVGAPPDACADAHYHAATGDSVTALDGTVIVDPAPAACGYGSAGDVPSYRVFDTGGAADADFDGIPDAAETVLGLDPDDPDSDGDGIPDGEEDSDMDLLSNSEEIYEFGTSASEADTDGNSTIDGVDVANSWQLRTYTFAPAAVGAYRFSGVDESEMRETVEYTNRLTAGLNLRFVPIGFATDVDAGDANMDGFLDATELRESQTFFNQLIDGTGENGVYLGFGGPGYLSSLDGAEGTAQFGSPNLFVEAQDGLDSASARERAASVLAHEAGHLEGAAHPAEGSANDVSWNIMQPLDERGPYVEANGLGGSFYTDLQLARTQALKPFRLFGRVYDHHEGVTTRRPQQLGRISDDFGDAMGGSVYDLDQVFLESAEGEDRISLAATLAHMPMPGDRVSLQVYWDTDDDPMTGVDAPGDALGVERSLRLYLDYELAGIVAWSYLTDHSTGDTTPGPVPFASVLEYQFSHGGGPVPAATGFLVQISKDSLGLSAPQVPVYVHSVPIYQPFTVNDSASLLFDRQAYQDDPRVTVSVPDPGGAAAAAAGAAAGPGDELALEVSGLTPGTPFHVSLDETEVLADTTDGSGAFEGSFTVPGGLAGGGHFVTARDDTGAFGATVVTTVPEPAPLLGGLAALGALASARLPQRAAARATRAR